MDQSIPSKWFYSTIIYSYLKVNCFEEVGGDQNLWLSEKGLFSVKISSYECHFLCEYHWFQCLKKKKGSFQGQVGSQKYFKKLTRTLPDSSITAAHHMVTISFSWDHWNQRYNFFFLILVLFLKGDINDKNHMVVGTRALISAFKHCCNNMH